MCAAITGQLDISKGQIGRLCPETNAFIVGASVGELEFEVEENELTLTVDNMVGEWAVFLPQATGIVPAAGNSSSVIRTAGGGRNDE